MYFDISMFHITCKKMSQYIFASTNQYQDPVSDIILMYQIPTYLKFKPAKQPLSKKVTENFFLLSLRKEKQH